MFVRKKWVKNWRLVKYIDGNNDNDDKKPGFFFSSSEGRKHIIIKFRIFYLKLFPETMDKNGYY